jgi:hypothetical protein
VLTPQTRDSQPSLFQVANNDQPGNNTTAKEVEELKKKLAAKTQDFGTPPTVLYPLNRAIDDSQQIR